MVQRFVTAMPVYLRSVSYLRDLADGVMGRGAISPQLLWHNSDGVAPDQPFVVPLSLQGPLRPVMRFHAEWRR